MRVERIKESYKSNKEGKKRETEEEEYNGEEIS